MYQHTEGTKKLTLSLEYSVVDCLNEKAEEGIVSDTIEYNTLSESNLEAALGILNRNLEYDNTTTLNLLRHKTIEDPDFDPSMGIIAYAEGEPHGFMFAVCRDEGDKRSATVKFFAVDSAYRNRGIATEMLSRIESRARAANAGVLRVGMSRPNYLMPGVDPRYTVACAFLLRRGFKRTGEVFNMDVDLSASDWSTDEIEKRLAMDGILCRRLEPNEKDRLLEWMSSEGYSSGWQYQTLCAAEVDPPAVFVAEKNGELIAFACFDGVRPGWFGPMGTRESMRGAGIGSVTFLKCLQDMKARGYRVCEINSVGPLYFYSKVANAKVSRIFWQFEKNLESMA